MPSKHDKLTQALNDLRREPGVDLPTLNKVDAVFQKLAGVRLTLKKGSKRQRRTEQAQALVPPGAAHSEAILAVCRGLGVSRSTAYRYVAALRQRARS